MARIGQFEVEALMSDPIRTGMGGAAEHVHVMVGQHTGHIGEKAGPVEGLHHDRHDIDRLAVVDRPVPLHIDDARPFPDLQRVRVATVGPMHRHATASGDKADDLVARHGRAAPGEAHEHVVEAVDMDPDIGTGP